MATQFLQHENGRIAYDVSGEGPLVICAPSIGDLRQEYRFLVPQLVQAGFRVAQMDLRGIGESSVQWDDYTVAGVGRDMLVLIQELDAGPAILVGTSMSAGAAVWAAAEKPESVSALVLIGASVHGEVSPANQMLYRALFARPWGPSLWVRYYKTLYPTQIPQDFEQYTSQLLTNLKQPGRIKAALDSMLADKNASEQRLPQVKAPALIVMGSKDPDFKDPQAEASWIAERMNAVTHIVQDAGHYPHAEMPEHTGKLVVDFLQSLELQPEGERVA